MVDDPLAAVRAIFERYRSGILEQIDNLEAATVALMEGLLTEEQRAGAERDAHKLAGSLGTFGFAQGSRVAREMEYALQQREIAAQDALKLSELVMQLRNEIDKTPETTTPGAPPPPPPPSAPGADPLLIVDDDVDLADRIAMEAHARGFDVVVAASPDEARTSFRSRIPTVVLLDLIFENDKDAGLDLLSELTETHHDVPVVVFTGSDDFTDRVEVARRGGRRLLLKPVSPSSAVDALKQVKKARSGRTTVMAVDDDPSILGALAGLLEPQGMRFIGVRDPDRLWDELREHSPDLLILDVDMPGVSGIELCRVLRNDPTFLTLPVLVLTARNDENLVADVFAAGADDFMSKPIVAPELLARVTGRLERNELLRALSERDPLTGLTVRAKAVDHLERFLTMGRRFEQPVALAAIDIDSLRIINERAGHALGDRVLKRFGELAKKSFHSDDVASRWGGGEFVIGMYGMTRTDGIHRVAELLDDMRHEVFKGPNGETFHVTFSAGVAQFPDDGDTVGALHASAMDALRAAKQTGAARTLPVGWTDRAGSTVGFDVAIVEDDDPLAGLLIHVFETRGFSTTRIADGTDAVRLLTGSTPEVTARVILLDVDLPGIDGLGILKRLSDAHVLSRSKVIMLTARSAELEVLRAMELGAFDHVAKPFSTPVLVQRVRRALGV